MNTQNYEQTVAIFIDILGSKEITGFEEKHKIHKIFHESILESQKRQETKDKDHVIYTRKLFSFSDCAFFFYRYKPEVQNNRKDINKLLQVALFNSAHITLELLNEGYILRGGITCGDVYFDDMSFFGPAVDRAYEIESKEAITPRILIDSKFGADLFKHETKIYSEVFGESNPNYHFMPKRSFIPTIAMKDGNDYILNTLYILEMENSIALGKTIITHNNLTNNLLIKIDSQIPNYPWNHKVRPKLEWMKEYLKTSKVSLVEPSQSSAYLV
jgi:hypothetical protein